MNKIVRPVLAALSVNGLTSKEVDDKLHANFIYIILLFFLVLRQVKLYNFKCRQSSLNVCVIST